MQRIDTKWHIWIEAFTNKLIKCNMAVEQKLQCRTPSSANKIVQANPDNGQKGSWIHSLWTHVR